VSSRVLLAARARPSSTGRRCGQLRQRAVEVRLWARRQPLHAIRKNGCGFGAYGPGKDVLDEISREETRNGRPDITFVLRSKTTGYPSQIGFKSAKPPDDTQKVQARTEAQRLIDAYAPAGKRNPYG
jgi:hypothetical protein